MTVDPSLATASVLWRRLDTPGHDACRLDADTVGWTINGAAVFLEGGMPTRLTYEVSCDREWLTRRGRVSGWLGTQRVEFTIARTAHGAWTMNDVVATGLERCVDVDFGFTPATNLLQLRRVALAVGQSAEVPVAWLDASAASLDLLGQRYERRSETEYWYEAPRFGYAAMLEVNPTGFIRRYPGLWEAEGSYSR